jgi:uncharacterized protein YbaR (Trm112 family)
MAIHPNLLELLACPVPECRGKLMQTPDWLVCVACGRRYRSEENWPVLIVEEAELPDPSEPARPELGAAGAKQQPDRPLRP